MMPTGFLKYKLMNRVNPVNPNEENNECALLQLGPI